MSIFACFWGLCATNIAWQDGHLVAQVPAAVHACAQQRRLACTCSLPKQYFYLKCLQAGAGAQGLHVIRSELSVRTGLESFPGPRLTRRKTWFQLDSYSVCPAHAIRDQNGC